MTRAIEKIVSHAVCYGFRTFTLHPEHHSLSKSCAVQITQHTRIMNNLMNLLVILLSSINAILATSRPVSIRDKSTGQLVTSSTLTWEKYVKDDEKQFEFAVDGGNFTTEDNSKAYICRSTISSIPVTGYVTTIDGIHACIISQHEELRTRREFDILVNKNNGSKLSWVNWEKLIPFGSINGAVSTDQGTSRSEIYYVARHKIDHTKERNNIDHAIGYFNPSNGLGKISVIIESEEKSLERGQILVAIEAVRYELFDIQFSKIKTITSINRTVLGHTILKNEADTENDVNTAIGYEYDIIRNFGPHEGMARFTNATAHLADGPFEFLWGMPKEIHSVNSKSVGTRLQPGTALNVTLYGNLTKHEGPFEAKVKTFWADGTETKKIRVKFLSGLESYLESTLEIEYSPTYWLHNNTVLPTTTVRTTTSTATENIHKSIFSTSMSSNAIERITEKSSNDELNETGASPSLLCNKSFVILIILLSLLKSIY